MFIYFFQNDLAPEGLAIEFAGQSLHKYIGTFEERIVTAGNEVKHFFEAYIYVGF